MKLTAHGTITLTANGTITLAENDERTLRGTIVSFDRPTDDGRGLIIRAGALNPRTPLSRTKLLRDHDAKDPVGYMVEISDDRRTATFHVPEGENGDRAIAEAQNGLRDGFSIGFTITKYEFDADDNLVVLEATIHEVSLVAIPAFSDAGIAFSAVFSATPSTTPKGTPMNRAQLAAALAAGTITQAEHDTQLAALDAADQAAASAAADRRAAAAVATPPAPAAVPGSPAPPAVGELAGVPQQLAARRQPAHTNDRPMSLQQLAAEVSSALARGDHGAVRQALALQDVLPADDAGNGLIRDDWRGELWTADRSDRPMVDALGAPSPLQTGSKVKGWAWDVKPDVQDYEGNKKAVPSNKVKTKAIETAVHRSAGGWDIDRLFLDLGEAGFLEAFWRAAVADYKLDSETYCSTELIKGATDLGAQATLLKAFGKLGAGFAKIGASLDSIFIAPDLFEAYAGMTQAEVPFWLANATGVSLKNGTATVADLNVRTHTGLAAGQVLAFDQRAATWFEKNPPIRVNAIDLPKGGVDLGLFGYDAVLINDPRALVKLQVGAAAPGGGE